MGWMILVEEFDRGPRPFGEGIILEGSETYTLADRVTETALAILSDPVFTGPFLRGPLALLLPILGSLSVFRLRVNERT